MINPRHFYITIFLMFITYVMSAQCPGPPMSVTGTGSVATCEANGSLVITPVGGVPFSGPGGTTFYYNSIVSPITIPGQQSPTFNSLAAGTYTVEVADACGTIATTTVVVPGTYQTLELGIYFEDAICDGSSGGVVCGTPSKGLPPYQYRLYNAATNPPTLLYVGPDSCHTNLAAGSYQIQAWDQCNNFQTRDVIVAVKDYPTDFRQFHFRRYFVCNEGCTIFTALENTNDYEPEYPVSWTVTSSTDPDLIGLSGQIDYRYEYDTICWSPAFQTGDYLMTMTDACGLVDTYRNYFQRFYVTGIDRYDCGIGNWFYFYTSSSYIPAVCTDGTITYETYQVPPGAPAIPPTTVDSFFNLQDGQYCWRITDCCGNVDSYCRTFRGPRWTMFASESFSWGCTNGLISFKCQYRDNGGPDPAGNEEYLLTSAPPGYPNPLPEAFSYYGTVEGPAGQYCFTVTDTCGRSIDTCFVINDPLMFTYNPVVEAGCVTANSITANFTQTGGNTASHRFYFYQVAPTYVNIQNGGINNSWYNLSPGSYRVRIWNNYSGCNFVDDTIVIPEYIPPTLEAAWGIECDNGVGLVTVNGANGNTPYTYELFQGPVTRPLQSSPTFPGLPLGTYSIRIYDDCLNSSINTVSIEPFAPLIKGNIDPVCEGDNATFYVDSLAIATYTWTGPNGFTSNNATVNFPNVTAADAGSYTVDIQVFNPDATACVDQQVTLDLIVLDCSCEMDTLVVTPVTCRGSNDAMVTAYLNGTPPFTYVWSNTGNTQTISNLSTGNYYVTVTDAKGCSDTGYAFVKNPPVFSFGVSTVQDVSCNGGGDGAITITPMGGVMPYTYEWEKDGQPYATANSNMITNLGAGQYSVIVTDANGCELTDQFRVDEAPKLTLLVDVDDVSCGQINDGSATVTGNGGTIPFTYMWSNGQTSAIASGLEIGVYTVSVTDRNGCCAIAMVRVEAVACDLCAAGNAGTIDICGIISDNPRSPLTTLDCDNGGIDNETECNNGGDPSDPDDDCRTVFTANLNLCVIIINDPTNPLATQDCDNGGVDNATECNTQEDPNNPVDDCSAAIDASLDICALINFDSTHPLAFRDCDNGGVSNLVECQNGQDPSDPDDDCLAAAESGMNICQIIAGGGHPWATLDCDNGGIDNETECASGTDPNDPSDDLDCPLDPCVEVTNENLDICVVLAGNPNSPLATLDCDGGGVSNQTECDNGEDPSDPEDDCQAAIDANLNICGIIANNPDHPLAMLDCDNGGVPNMIECQSGEDPTDPADDCQAAIDSGTNICVLINYDATHPLATLDCDNGGVSNYMECVNGEDPSDPADDCQAAAEGGLDICTIIAGGGHPWAALDCDNGGVDNETECASGTDPNDPSDDLDCPLDPCVEAADADICSIIDGDPTGPLATLDCDGGGVDNGTECMEGTDPSDPADDCTAASSAGMDVCAVLTADPSNPLATQDCDNGGVDNQTECAAGTNPNAASDDCQAAIAEALNICALINYDPNHPLANLDCDDGGVDNFTECTNGQDPATAGDDCEAAASAGMDICTIIAGGGHPWATLDCDMGGVDNQTECDDGLDPTVPSDDIDCPTDFCEEAATDGTDICAVLTADPNHPLASLDCDNGGIDNQTECANGTDPDEASDDCQAAAAGNVDICAMINGDPSHPLANQDCDNGGVSNIDECNSAEEPFDPADDCQAAIDEGLNICQLINYDTNHPMADLDCDDGGIDNYTECQSGGDPADPADDCTVVVDQEIDLCALIMSDPTNPISSSDCDGDGVSNGMECTDSTDPLDPCDFEDTSISMPVTADQSNCEGLCPDLTPIMTILPGNIAGVSGVGVAVKVTELNTRDTDGSLIRVRIPNDPRFVFVWNPNLTTAALTPVNNADWNYQGIIGGLFHEWHYTSNSGTIIGGATEAFGFEGTYDPQSTDGQTTITATVFPFSGGECNLSNNTDSERLVYFE